MLMQMVQQRLTETWQHENSLRTSFEQARAEAVNLNGDLARLEILEHDLKWLRDLRDVLLNQIASIDLKQDHGDIRTAVVSEPALPKTADLAEAAARGRVLLAGGLASGWDWSTCSTFSTIASARPKNCARSLGVPVLAMVRQMEDLHARGLEGVQITSQPDAVESEAFRTLRTTLAFTSQERRGWSSPAPSRATARPRCWRIWPCRSRSPARRRC